MLINGEEITNIRKKPWWMYFLPGIGGKSCVALYPNFYVPRFVYEDLSSEHPSVRYVSICLHELEHLRRAKVCGVAKYYLLYIFSSKFRFQEELACRMREYEFCISQGRTFDFEDEARALSGWIYLRCCTYEQALEALRSESKKLHP